MAPAHSQTLFDKMAASKSPSDTDLSSCAEETSNSSTAGSTINPDADVPSDFLCPLTLEIMTDPLMSRYGHSYERSAIMSWLNQGNMDCPLTKKPLTASGLIPNERLRTKIVGWRLSNGYGLPQRQETRDFYMKDFSEDDPLAVTGILVVPPTAKAEQDVTTTTTTEASSSSRRRGPRGIIKRIKKSLRATTASQ